MKVLNLSLGLLAMGTMLTGCKKEYNGMTQITKALEAQTKPNSARIVLIQPGNYNTNIKVSSNTTQLAFSNGGGTQNFTIATPKNLSSGGLFQDFELSPAQIGQTFGLSGKAESRTTDSAPTTTTESCVYDSYQREVCHPGYWERGYRRCDPDRRECRRVRDGSDDGYRCEWYTVPGRCYNEPDRWVPGYCETRTEYVYGHRTIRGINRTTQTTLTVKFKSETKSTLGTMTVQDEPHTVRVNEEAGPCLR